MKLSFNIGCILTPPRGLFVPPFRSADQIRYTVHARQTKPWPQLS
ncbi:hypothetical protein RMSM_01285 [Rhodopirellula maiorica SM1]|uniref:Uncharacterized protein n=1 Tax=Rhodopirellula maiorica SM1 TaxID=1265738 RepID=M5S2E0_9BACT|nr:hypothetical protein RMSM_01285 [Rhodopirellula maiorica SM1]